MKPSVATLNSAEESRLRLAFSVALILHAAVIFGIGFTSLTPTEEPALTLNITLVEKTGGRPSIITTADDPIAPLPATPPLATVSPTATPPQPALPERIDAPPARVSKPLPTATSQSASKATPKKPEKIPPETVASPAAGTGVPPPTNKLGAAPLNAIDLMTHSLQMARLDTSSRLASTSRDKRINQESMTTLEKFYMQAWQRKVEHVGTLNFPQEARRLNLTNGPTLDVAIRADGSVQSILLVRSSGHPALDNAARRIVALAAPYTPFPAELRRQYDVLHIVRKWKFEQSILLQ